MLHPTMVLLLHYNSKTLCLENVDLSFLSSKDTNIIHAEIDKMISILSEDKIFYETYNNIKVASTTQYTLTEQISISRETAIVLTKLSEACDFWSKNIGDSTEGNSNDLSSDMLLTKIDAFPTSIYRIVYNILSEERPTISGNKKGILKLHDLLKKILLYNNQAQADISGEILEKINNLSSMNFWRNLLSTEYMRYYSEVPKDITLDTMTKIKNELKYFDIHGFVPPNKVYQAFSSVTEYRKNTIHVDDEIIDFLTKIVRSGGITL